MRPEVERMRELKPCPSCGGLGWIIVPEWSLDRVDCPDCEGTGKVIGNIHDNPELLEVKSMANWSTIVFCPGCGRKKEVSLEQRRWKCSCGRRYDVNDTKWRPWKRVERDE